MFGCGEKKGYRFGLDRTVPVRLTEYKITPQNIVVKAGRIHLIARNDGRLTHNLVVEDRIQEVGVEPHIYGRTRTLHPGEIGTELVPFRLAPGRYRLTCTISNHDDLGQYGELLVIP